VDAPCGLTDERSSPGSGIFLRGPSANDAVRPFDGLESPPANPMGDRRRTTLSWAASQGEKDSESLSPPEANWPPCQVDAVLLGCSQPMSACCSQVNPAPTHGTARFDVAEDNLHCAHCRKSMSFTEPEQRMRLYRCVQPFCNRNSWAVVCLLCKPKSIVRQGCSSKASNEAKKHADGKNHKKLLERWLESAPSRRVHHGAAAALLQRSTRTARDLEEERRTERVGPARAGTEEVARVHGPEDVATGGARMQDVATAGAGMAMTGAGEELSGVQAAVLERVGWVEVSYMPRVSLQLAHILLEYAATDHADHAFRDSIRRYFHQPSAPIWRLQPATLADVLRVPVQSRGVAGVCRSLGVAEEHIATVTEESMGSAEGDVVWAVVRSGLHFPTDVSLWEGWRAEWLERRRQYDYDTAAAAESAPSEAGARVRTGTEPESSRANLNLARSASESSVSHYYTARAAMLEEASERMAMLDIAPIRGATRRLTAAARDRDTGSAARNPSCPGPSESGDPGHSQP